MPKSTDDVIADLRAFVPRDDGRDVGRLYDILEGFEELPDRRRAFPELFAVMERFPNSDLGTPGPLVSSIETVAIAEFKPLLRESIERRPVHLNMWMVNRILNTKLPRQHREELLKLLRSVKGHLRADAADCKTADEYLKFQAERETS